MLKYAKEAAEAEKEIYHTDHEDELSELSDEKNAEISTWKWRSFYALICGMMLPTLLNLVYIRTGL